MTLERLEQLELAQRKAMMRLIRAEFVQSTPAQRLELKICRETLRAMRTEIRKMRDSA